MARNTHQYCQASGSDALLSESESFDQSSLEKAPRVTSKRQVSGILTSAALVIFAGMSLFFLVAYLTKQPTEKQCVREISTYCELPSTSEIGL